MKNYSLIKQSLEKSSFRSKFRLDAEDRAYIHKTGLDTIEKHARDFIEKRLSIIVPLKDGKQTPFKGHPVFKAQHATATCCRGCLLKWYDIPKDRRLSEQESSTISNIIMEWIRWNIQLKDAKTKAGEDGRRT